MMAFISKNIKYPVAAQKAKIQGRVVIQFIVDKEGNIICPRVIRGADPLLDAEAIRLTTIMPKWKPGMQRGQAVNVKYTVPHHVPSARTGEKPCCPECHCYSN